MSILIRRVVTLALTLVTLTLLAACGPSNNVRLIYNTNTSAYLAAGLTRPLTVNSIDCPARRRISCT